MAAAAENELTYARVEAAIDCLLLQVSCRTHLEKSIVRENALKLKQRVGVLLRHRCKFEGG